MFLDDEVEEGLELGVAETGRRSGSSFGHKKQELVEILSPYSIKGTVLKKRLPISKQITIALPGFLFGIVLLMILEQLYCLL